MAKWDLSNIQQPQIINGDTKTYIDNKVEQANNMTVTPLYPTHKTGAKREKLNNLRYDLFPARIVNDAYANVANHGMIKYGARNWESGIPMSQISASLQRHLWEFMDGKEFDDDSNLPHVHHILWNAVALAYNYHNKLEDDRIPVVKH